MKSWDYDYADGDSNPFPVGEFGECDDDHGTCCAGEIAMEKSNSYCGVGVAYHSAITGMSYYRSSLYTALVYA